MRPRTTLALAILALVLVSLVVFWEHERPGTREEAELERRLLPARTETSNFERIEIEREGMTLALARDAGGWALHEPLVDLASEEKVERLLDTLDAIEVLARVPEADVDATLGRPALRLTLEGPAQLTELELFDLKLAETLVYARVDSSPDLLLLPTRLLEELTLSADEIREERALDLSAAEIARFELSGVDIEPLAFERSGKGWRVLRPYEDEADSSRVSALLDLLVALRADRFASREELAPDAPDASASQAWLAFTALDSEGEFLTRLEIGARSAEAVSRRWARVEGRPGFLRVDARGVARQLAGDNESWRSLLVLDFAPSELRRVRVESPEGTMQMERPSPDSPWVDAGSGAALDQEKIAEIVFQLARVEADAVCEACAMPSAGEVSRLRLEVFDEEGATHPLTSLEILEDPDDTTRVLVRRSDRQPLFLVPAAPFALLEPLSLTVSKPRE